MIDDVNDGIDDIDDDNNEGIDDDVHIKAVAVGGLAHWLGDWLDQGTTWN